MKVIIAIAVVAALHLPSLFHKTPGERKLYCSIKVGNTRKDFRTASNAEMIPLYVQQLCQPTDSVIIGNGFGFVKKQDKKVVEQVSITFYNFGKEHELIPVNDWLQFPESSPQWTYLSQPNEWEYVKEIACPVTIGVSISYLDESGNLWSSISKGDNPHRIQQDSSHFIIKKTRRTSYKGNEYCLELKGSFSSKLYNVQLDSIISAKGSFNGVLFNAHK